MKIINQVIVVIRDNKRIPTLVVLLCLCLPSVFLGTLNAQTVNDVALRGLRTVHQNSFINPSWIPDTNLMGEYRASTGFHFGGDIRSNFLVIRDVFNSLNANNDIQFLKLLTPPLSTFSYTGITISSGMGVTTMRPLSRGGLHLTLGYQIRSQSSINLNGSELANSKNATLTSINKNVARGMAWGDLSVGISGRYRSFDYGFRVKYLLGLAYANLDVDASGFIKEDTVRVHVNKLSFSKGYMGDNPYSLFSPSGHGVAVDLGLTFRISRNTSIDFSLLDLGFIGWNQSTPAKVINNQTYNVGYLNENSFTPVNFSQRYLDANPILKKFEVDLRDSLIDNSVMPLYSQLSLGIKHNFNPNLQVGAVYHRINAPAAFQYAFSTYISYRFLRNWELTANTGLREGGISAVGMGLSYTSSTFQAFITTENILMFPFTYYSKNFHILLGVNFRVGKQSIKLLGPVDKVLCPDPIVDEGVDELAVMTRRRGFLQGFKRQKRGLRYATDGELENLISGYGKENKNTRKYNNSYSEILRKAGKEGGQFNEVEYIGEKLSERQLPEYNPKPVEIKDYDQQNSKEGRSGGYYNEKEQIDLPKRKSVKPREGEETSGTKTSKKWSIFGDRGNSGRKKERNLDINYGQRGGASAGKEKEIKIPKNKVRPQKQKNSGLNFGSKGGGTK